MTDALNSWWSGLSPREQILVSIAGALTSGIIGWFLVFMPLQGAIASAAATHSAAVDREAAVRSRVAALRARATYSTTNSGAAVTQMVTQAAAEAGLPLARNDPAGPNGAVIAISSGRSAAILTMLAVLEGQRVRASDLTLRPNDDGSISLTATLRRGGA